jgi:small nuclear ribonucleoprotein (snRNP)-like protein
MNFLQKYPELRQVLVNLKSGTAFKGVVFQRKSDYLVLKSAEIIQDRGQAAKKQPVDGEVLIFRADIDFIQVI